MKKFLIYVTVGIIAFAIGYNVNVHYFAGKSPAQPITFNHRVHAGDNRIPCMYCHIYGERSTVAGVPSVQRCMGCHTVIKREAPEIVKLAGYWERREPIPWIKIYNLPDFVYFSHKRHLKAGVQCETCHGDVTGMDVTDRVSSLKMGWCLDCHIQRDVKNGQDCWTCHK